MWRKSSPKGVVEKVTPVPPYGRERKPPQSFEGEQWCPWCWHFVAVTNGSVALFELSISTRLADAISEPGGQDTTLDSGGGRIALTRALTDSSRPLTPTDP